MPLALAIISLGAAGLTPAAKKKPPAHPININSADSSELQLVPGIGPATAEKILQTRKSYGSFKTVDDLLSIRGIGPKRLEKMRKYLTVGKVAGKPATSTTAAAPTPTVKNKAAPKTAASKAAPPKASADKPDGASEEEEPR
jgi:competence ComEA-like helix-hairpin-helix protein